MMAYTAADPWFGDALKSAGWKEVVPYVEFRKGDRRLVFDTSSWIAVGNATNPRIFDVPVPERDRADWTIKLIDHLFAAEEAKLGPFLEAKSSRNTHPQKGSGWLLKVVALAAFVAMGWIAVTLLINSGFDFALPT